MYTNSSWKNPPGIFKEIPEGLRKRTACYDGVAWYGTEIRIPADWKDRRIFLYFGAAAGSCQVYVNGMEAGARLREKAGGRDAPFTIPIDRAVDWKRPKQNIIVRVEDKSGRGGIRKPVWLLSRK